MKTMKAMKCALLVQCAFILSHAFCLRPARISSSANILGGYHEGQDAFGETLKCFRILSADKAQEGFFGAGRKLQVIQLFLWHTFHSVP